MSIYSTACIIAHQVNAVYSTQLPGIILLPHVPGIYYAVRDESLRGNIGTYLCLPASHSGPVRGSSSIKIHKRMAGPDDWARFLSSYRPILEAEHTDWEIGGDAIYCVLCPDEHTHYHTSPTSDTWVFRRVGGGGVSPHRSM